MMPEHRAKFEIVVVGAGVVGACLALRLAKAGARVALVDRAGPGQGTTGASFAYANASRKMVRPYFDLNLAGVRAHRTLRDELGDAPWLIEGGRLAWASDPTGGGALAAEAAQAAAWGYAAEWLDRSQVAELEPGLRLEEGVERAVLYPEEASIDAPLLAQTLADFAARSGAATRFGATVVGFRSDRGRITGVILTTGEVVNANLVVNCAGPDADRIAELAGRRLPLRPTLGLIVRVVGLPNAVRRLLYGPQVQIRPDSRDNGLLMLHLHPADEAVAAGDRPAAWAEELVRRARAYLPSGGAPRIERWSIGVRPMPADGFPSAGLLPATPGYGEVVTHSGVTLGPLLGRLVAQEIVDGRVDPLLAPFRPDRFDEAGTTNVAGAPAPSIASA